MANPAAWAATRRFWKSAARLCWRGKLKQSRAAGAAEVFISGRADTDYSAFGCRVLKDQFPDAGPLAGIEAALAVATNPLLLVLAVDLPEMRPDFLCRLATRLRGKFRCRSASWQRHRTAGSVLSASSAHAGGNANPPCAQGRAGFRGGLCAGRAGQFCRFAGGGRWVSCQLEFIGRPPKSWRTAPPPTDHARFIFRPAQGCDRLATRLNSPSPRR